MVQTKTCPFCAEDIKEQAIKCRYCHEAVDSATLARLITKEQLAAVSHQINERLAAKDHGKARELTAQMILQIKQAPNARSFEQEYVNALQAYKALGGDTAELLGQKHAGSNGGAYWGVGVTLPLAALFGSETN